MKYGILERKMDRQGRVVLPAKWRKRVMEGTDRAVVMLVREDKIIILPKKGKDLTSFYAKAKKSPLKPDPFEDFEKSLAEASV